VLKDLIMEEPTPILVDRRERSILRYALTIMIEQLGTGYDWENRQAEVDDAKRVLARLQQDASATLGA